MRYSDNPKDWFDESLELNREYRFSHGKVCTELSPNESPDRRGRLFVRKTSKGFKWYCHNCGCGGTKTRAVGEMAKHVLDSKSTPNKVGIKPLYYPVLQLYLLGWVYNYGLTKEEVKKYQIGYSEKFDRIILPIISFDGDIVGWQGRGDKPKYITQYFEEDKTKRAGSWFRCGSDSVVIVEDILSAIKCSRLIDSVALLSSPKHLPQQVVSLITDNYKQVYTWLDDDKKGAALNYHKRFTSLYDIKSNIIFTDKDPKEYETEDIKEKLNDMP